MISGAESVRAMKPSLAVVTSGVSAEATGLGEAGDAAVEDAGEELVLAVLEELQPFSNNSWELYTAVLEKVVPSWF